MGVADAQTRFFTNHPRQKHKASTARENARILSRHFLPRFQGRDLASVTAPDLSQVLDRLQGTPPRDNGALRYASTMKRLACASYSG